MNQPWRMALVLAGLLTAAPSGATDSAELLLESAAAWEQQNRPDLARVALEKLLAAQPGHPQASLALGDLEIRSGRIDAARAVLQNLRERHPGHPLATQLAETLRVLTRDRLQLATMRRLYETGRLAEAAEAARVLFPDGPPPGPLGDEYRTIVTRVAALEPPSARPPPAAKKGRQQRRTDWDAVARQRADALQRDAEDARQAGQTGVALRHLEEAQALQPDDPWARYRLARLYAELGLEDEARQLAAEGVRRAPQAVDPRFAQALLLSALDDHGGALQAIEQIPESARTDNIRDLDRRLRFSLAEQDLQSLWARGERGAARARLAELRSAQDADAARLDSLVALALQHDDLPAAMATAQRAVEIAPQARETQLAQARIDRARGRYNEAARGYAAVREREMREAHQGYSAAAAGLEALAARRDGAATLAPRYYDKSGDAGISAYRARTLTLQWRQPYRYEDHFFAIADWVDAEAGVLPADFDASERYGSIRAAGPGAIAALGSGLPQSAQGVALGLGWERASWRLDLGSTPLGFPVENWVGGLRWSGDWAAWSLNAGAARRPVTGSLVSYAGARDPASNRVWGGVVSTGVDGRIAQRRERLSMALSAGAYLLSGRNVPDNPHQNARLSADWRVLERPDQRLELGLALSGWRYGENLGEYSFGHGGYYSPQRYLSASLPLEWSGRHRQLSWLLRGAVSVSRTHTAAQLYYPGDTSLQSAADLQGGDPARYEGGDGGGSGVSLQAAAEYRLHRHWFAGAAVDIERSEFYTPNSFNLWLRYDFDGHPAELRYPPRPPRPYSEY
jgi:cellulose synthase operon protein C